MIDLRLVPSTRILHAIGYGILVDGRESKLYYLQVDDHEYINAKLTDQIYYLPLSMEVYVGTARFCFSDLLLDCVDVASNTYHRMGVLKSWSSEEEFTEDPLMSLLAGRLEPKGNGEFIFQQDPSRYRESTIT